MQSNRVTTKSTSSIAAAERGNLRAIKGEGRTLPEHDAPALPLTDIERWAIESAVRRCAGNLSRASRELGIGRTTLYRKLKEYEG